MNIAFCFAGSQAHHRDWRRSTTVDLWRPLWVLPGTHWSSIYVGPRTTELVGLPPNVIDRSEDITGDVERTAEIVEASDLIITVDTMVAHLAGSLHRPVWVLLSAPDWRWGLNGDRSPWYPTLRLYRQAALGDWAPVMAKVESDLRLVMAGHRLQGAELLAPAPALGNDAAF